MERLKKAAIVTSLIERLRERGSWCGETHIQKATLFLQDMLKVPTDFDYILYRHGPFSFDLRDELTALRGDEILKIEPQSPPYGPKIGVTERAAYIQGLFRKTLADYNPRVDFVADQLGAKGVSELERLATALWVTRNHASMPVADRAVGVTNLKPHIEISEAEAAIRTVDTMRRESRDLIG